MIRKIYNSYNEGDDNVKNFMKGLFIAIGGLLIGLIGFLIGKKHR